MGGAGGNPTLATRARVPEHVVHRDFGDETVILNLATGMYHGLNETAAAMLGTLEASDSVEAAVASLTERFGQPRAVIEADVLELCGVLAERGLIELDDGAGD
jgi:hypothetical protein